MSAWPFIERDLKAFLRQRTRPFDHRIAISLLGLATLVNAIYSSLEGQPSGRFLYLLLVGTMLLAILNKSAAFAISAFGNEQSDGTLRLLHLCGLSGSDQLFGKAVAGMAMMGYTVLACFPMLILTATIGGISFQLLFLTLPMLLSLMIACESAAVLASAVGGRTGTEAVWFYVLIILMNGAGVLLYAGDVALGSGTGSFWLGLSPAYSAFCALTDSVRPSNPNKWWSVLAGIGWSCVLFFAASKVVRARWRREVFQEDSSPIGKLFQKIFNVLPVAAQPHRPSQLDSNPYTWLITHDRKPLVISVAGIGFIVCAWIVGAILWPAGWLTVVPFMLTGLIILTGTMKLTRFFAARQLAADRRNGTLEMLLVTKLSPEDIVAGQEQALVHQTSWLAKGGFVVCAILALTGLFLRSWNVGALVTYVICWAWMLGLIARCGKAECANALWVALNTGRTARREKSNPWLLLFWLLQLYSWRPMSGIPRVAGNSFPTGDTSEVIVFILGSIVALAILAAQRHSRKGDDVRIRMIKEFREIAATPVPSSKDPRLAKWDEKERLPSLEPESAS